MTTTQEPVIQALEVHKAFGELDILKGVSLEVRRGEVVVLIGASGSGKTTFIRCLNHLEDIQGGTIPVERDEPLRRELIDFVKAIRGGGNPLVDGEAGRRALTLASQIAERMETVG